MPNNIVPTALKELRGTLRPHRQTPNEPEPPEFLPAKPPDYLSERQKAIWNATIAAVPLGLLRTADEGVVVRYCVARELFELAAADCSKNGYQVHGRHGVRISPALETLSKTAVIMHQCEVELGLGPATRTKINTKAGTASATGAEDDDHWQQLALM